ncbi:hypothetical protein [Streptomyces sp. enrichment culture]|uniref:hypothetical protein n=1 Tax=Streptomyces sp. enrichment culture TaxID=1795815 RepID=UPI003F566DE9
MRIIHEHSEENRREAGCRTAAADDAERAGTGPGRDLVALLAGAATAAAGAGALLALGDPGSPLRGPLALFFLLAAPATAIAVVLPGTDPLGRVIAALGGAIVLDLLVVQGLLALRQWSVRGGIVTVAAISLLLLLTVPLRRLREHGARGRDV